jgi:hypothetical protein
MKPFAVVGVALLVAGCLASMDSPTRFDDARRAVEQAAKTVLVMDHDMDRGHHRAVHHKAAVNLELVGYSNGVDDSGDPNRIPGRGSYNEIALHGPYAYLSRSSPDGSFAGFSVVDVSDPTRPRFVGQFAGQGGNDVEVNAAGDLVFFATQRNTVDQVVAGIHREPLAGPRGIHVVDVTDPARPRLDGFHPVPYNGPHTLTYYNHPNGNEYLIACTYDLITDPSGAIVGAAPLTQRLIVYLIAPNPGVPGLPRVALLPVAQFQLPAAGDGMYFPHDTAVQLHEASGRILITVAYWDHGVRLLDFTEPPAPGPESGLPRLVELGRFTDFGPSAFDAIHYAKAFDAPLRTLEGDLVHVTVAEPEIINAEGETGQITFLDTTDPAAPRKLSWWTLPPQDPALGVTNIDFSPHNFDTWDGKVALAHYHAGVWVIDVSTPQNLANPVSVAFYMPAIVRADSPAMQPDAWSVRVRDGLLFVSDSATGLHILRYTGP